MIIVFVLYGGIMRKFNVDELIWFIILTLLSVSIIFLIKSGNITNFVGADMIKYFYVSIVILVLFAFIQFGRIFTIKRRMEITNKFIPLTFTLCIGVILFFLIPLLKNDDIVSKLITFLQSYGMLLIVIFLSVAISCAMILIKKPKKILSKIS